jgi:hypothetical protein
MSVFSIASPILSMLLILTLSDREGRTWYTIGRDAIRGLFLGGLFFLVYSPINIFFPLEQLIPFSYTIGGAYFSDFFLYWFLPSAVFLLSNYLVYGSISVEEQFYPRFLAFAGALFTVFSVYTAWIVFPHHTLYDLFLLPLLRVSYLLIMGSLWIYFHENYGMQKILYLLLILFILLIMPIPGMLFNFRMVFFSILSTIILLALAVFLFIKDHYLSRSM